MPSPPPLSMLLALALPAVAVTAPETRAQVRIRERIIIRIPRVAVPGAAAAPPRPISWREKKGPKCVPVDALGGAMIASPKLVDLVLIGGQRVRAKLEHDCKPLDFYDGFYLRPSADGMICADRDAIKMRSGASCGIDEFKALVPGK